MVFSNLTETIAEETQGDYSFSHVDVAGYNTLYLKKLSNVIMYDMVNRPLKNIIEQHLSNLKGDVLICGLGCGFSVFPLLGSEDINSITVIENDATIIAMMEPYLPTVTIIEADATTYIPAQSFDSIYMDIWQHNDIELKRNETIRYLKYLKIDGYLNYLNFNGFTILNYEKDTENHSIGTIVLQEDPYRYYGTGDFYHLEDENKRQYQEHWKTSGGSATGQMKTTIILPEDFYSFPENALMFDTMKDNDPNTFTLSIYNDGVVDPTVNGVDIKSTEDNLTWQSKTANLTGSYVAGDELFIVFTSNILTDSSGNEVDRPKLIYNKK